MSLRSARTTSKLKLKKFGGRNSIDTKKPIETDDSNSSEASSSTDDEERWKETKRAIEDLPADYWAIQKLVKYIKAGNTTATTVALCCLKDYDLTTHLNQLVSISFQLVPNK